jgi:hypothetical protein
MGNALTRRGSESGLKRYDVRKRGRERRRGS